MATRWLCKHASEVDFQIPVCCYEDVYNWLHHELRKDDEPKDSEDAKEGGGDRGAGSEVSEEGVEDDSTEKPSAFT